MSKDSTIGPTPWIETQPMIDRKIEDIRAHFAAIIGERIVRYETAELLVDDGTWESWPDRPIRLYTGSSGVVAISWSRLTSVPAIKLTLYQI
jgi:hypothetical protein